jgi:hypothetical protein
MYCRCSGSRSKPCGVSTFKHRLNFFSLCFRIFREVPEQIQRVVRPSRVARMGWAHNELQVLQLLHKHEREEDQARLRLSQGELFIINYDCYLLSGVTCPTARFLLGGESSVINHSATICYIFEKSLFEFNYGLD